MSKERYFRALTCWAACLSLTIALATARAEEQTIDEALTHAFERYRTLGACVAVIANGEIVYTYTYGERDPDGEKVTEDTLFRVGSISKMITAIGVLRLVDDGALTLDGPLSDALGFAVYAPDYPRRAITLRQVMTHTAGLRDGGFYVRALRGDIRPLDALLPGGEHVYIAERKPGTKAEYSNFGGGLLGSVIEAVSGLTVDEYMRQNVFEPLGITAAYQAALLPADAPVANEYAMPARRLTARLRDGTPARTKADPLRAYTLTAGKLTISAPDLAKLLIALCDGGVCGNARVLSESLALEMRTEQDGRGTVIGPCGRGLCMNLIEDTVAEGRLMVGHGGKANGMLCAAYFDPTDRTGVVMLTNGCVDTAYNGVGKLSRAVIGGCYQLLLGDHVAVNPFVVEE